MRRIAVGLVAVLALSSCAENTPPAQRVGSESSEWYSLVDPENGRTFRCHQAGYDTYGGHVVWTEWCYEP